MIRIAAKHSRKEAVAHMSFQLWWVEFVFLFSYPMEKQEKGQIKVEFLLQQFSSLSHSLMENGKAGVELHTHYADFIFFSRQSIKDLCIFHQN